MGSHHLPFSSILCAFPWGSHPNGILSLDFHLRVSKFPKFKLSQFWGAITLCSNLWLRWGLKQSCSFRQELFKCMLHATCTQGNRVDSRLLMVGSPIANLTFNLSFGHNLCFKCPNGSCKFILDIYVSKVFQWQKKIFNPMGFDPCNCLLNIWESIGILPPKMGVHLEMWKFIPSHSFAFPGAWNVTPRVPLGLQPCKPLLWSRTQG